MICDYETDKVYLAEGIKGYPGVAEKLLMALYNEGIDTEFLPRSASKKHVWARDYMPVQLEGDRFLQYIYAPDYLKAAPEYIPPYHAICRSLKLRCKKAMVVLDGGNVVKLDGGVIMTDKVLKENKASDADSFRWGLEKLLECDVHFIPWDRYEMFGHSDGMVRSIRDRLVLLNNYIDFDKDLRRQLKECLMRKGFIVEELHYDMPRPSKYSWAYLNFLQVKNRIFVPGLGLDEDWKAVEQIRQFFPSHKVILVPGCQDLVRDGGALNCVTWNILKNKEVEPEEDLPE